MIIKKLATSGTLESSDAHVTVQPGEGIKLTLDSSVINQYGPQICETVYKVLERLDVKDVHIRIVDRGALDWTLKERIESAEIRGAEYTGKINWWGDIIWHTQIKKD